MQEGVAKKIKPRKQKVAPVCTGYLKALTKTKFSGLMYYVEGKGIGREIDVLLEDPIEEKARATWEDDNFGTTSVITKSPSSLTKWRNSKPEWLEAKKAIDVFFTGTVEDYRKLFTNEQWSARKKVCADLCGVTEKLVSDEMLKAKFEEAQKAAVARSNTQVANWKKNPRNKDVSDADVEEHLNQIAADILFMTGRELAESEEDKWQMLYEHTLKDQQDHVDACAKLLGYDGNNFEHVMIAFNKDIIDVNDGIFARRDRSKEKLALELVPVKSLPVAIAHNEKNASESASSARGQHSPVKASVIDVLNTKAGSDLMLAVAKKQVKQEDANEVIISVANMVEEQRSQSSSHSRSSSDQEAGVDRTSDVPVKAKRKSSVVMVPAVETESQTQYESPPSPYLLNTIFANKQETSGNVKGIDIVSDKKIPNGAPMHRSVSASDLYGKSRHEPANNLRLIKPVNVNNTHSNKFSI